MFSISSPQSGMTCVSTAGAVLALEKLLWYAYMLSRPSHQCMSARGGYKGLSLETLMLPLVLDKRTSSASCLPVLLSYCRAAVLSSCRPVFLSSCLLVFLSSRLSRSGCRQSSMATVQSRCDDPSPAQLIALHCSTPLQHTCCILLFVFRCRDTLTSVVAP